VPATVTYREAVAISLAQEMARDPSVALIGEDVGAAGGVFKATTGLLELRVPARPRHADI
jgi:pyruvate/2-oxoglutarate/acetoin dehydrogenase E1 component